MTTRITEALYVAMTRAKDELDILYIEGSGNARQRSRFIEELIV